MPKAAPIRSTFNSGELSPLMDGRVDIAKYNNGCRVLENFIPSVQGPAVRRAGTRYVNEVKDSEQRVWLATFEFNIEQAYVLEFGDRYVRFFTDRGQVFNDDGTPYEITTPYLGADLTDDVDGSFTLSMVQSGDIIFITHPKYPVQKLSRYGNRNWTIAAAELKDGPFEPQNIDRNIKVYVTDAAGAQFINNPEFATNITGWTKASSANTTVAWNSGNAGRLSLISSATEKAIARQTLTNLVVGQTYTLTYDSNGKNKIKIGTSLGSNDVFESPQFATGLFYYNFTASASTQYVEIFNDLNTTSYINKVRIGPPVALTASRAIFSPDHVGGLFYLEPEDLSTIKPWTAGQEFAATPFGTYRRSDGKTYICTTTGAPASGKVWRTGADKPIHTYGIVTDGGGQSISGTSVTREGLEWQYVDSGFIVVEITGYLSPTNVTCEIKSQWSIPQGLLYPATTGTNKSVTAIAASQNTTIRATVTNHGLPNNSMVNVSLPYTTMVDTSGTDQYGNPVGGITYTDLTYTGVSKIYVIDANTIDLVDVSWPLDANYYAFRDGGFVNTIAAGGTSGTFRYAFGSFSDHFGYPSKVTFFRERLTFAKGQKLHFSVAGDFENFASKNDAGEVVADRAIQITISSDSVNRVEWLVPTQVLLIGTSASEFACSENSTNEAFAPGNIKIEEQTSEGSRSVTPVRVGYSTLFVQRSGRKVKEAAYNFQQNGYITTDLTVLAEHITRSGIVQTTWHKEPYVAMWAARADGKLLGFTFNRDQDVIGWHRHTIGGGGIVESVAVIPNPAGDRDDLWLVVKRTINGQTKRHVEYLEREFEQGDDQKTAYYVDGGGSYTGTPTKAVNGLDWLEGATVQVLADGAAHPDRVVQNGRVELQREASIVHIGFACPAILQTNRIEAGGGDGTSQGKTKRINKVVIRFYNTLGAQAGPNEASLDPIEFRSPSDLMDQAPPLFTGDKLMEWPSGYDFDGYVMVVQDQPLPMTVVAIMPQVHTFDR